MVACRQAPAQGTSVHICFSSALNLGSAVPEKVPACRTWMRDFDQLALILCVCACTPQPCFTNIQCSTIDCLNMKTKHLSNMKKATCQRAEVNSMRSERLTEMEVGKRE